LRRELTDALVALAPHAGCNGVIELAATTRNEVEARYLVDALALIRREVAPASGSLLTAGAAVAWRGDDARIVLPLPVDYLTWSHDIDGFLDQPAFAVADKTVLIGGQASLRAQRGLTERGWNLRLRQNRGAPGAFAGLARPHACPHSCGDRDRPARGR